MTGKSKAGVFCVAVYALAAFLCVRAEAHVPNALCEQAAPVNLPELLQTKDGKKISSVPDWEARRQELLGFFTRNVYGECPVKRPADLSFEPIGEDVELPGLPAVLKRVLLSFPGPRGAWHFDAASTISITTAGTATWTLRTAT